MKTRDDEPLSLRVIAATQFISNKAAAMRILAPMLEHGTEEERLAAVETLGRIGGPEAAKLLKTYFTPERQRTLTENERRAVLRAMLLMENFHL